MVRGRAGGGLREGGQPYMAHNSGGGGSQQQLNGGSCSRRSGSRGGSTSAPRTCTHATQELGFAFWRLQVGHMCRSTTYTTTNDCRGEVERGKGKGSEVTEGKGERHATVGGGGGEER